MAKQRDRFVVAAIVVLLLGVVTWVVGRTFPDTWSVSIAATYAPAEMHLTPPALMIIVALAMRRWRALAIAVASLGFAIVVLTGYTFASSPKPSRGNGLSVLTYNVDKWIFGGEAIAKSVLARSPDVVCLQEAGRYWWNRDPNLEPEAFERTLEGYKVVGEGENRVASRLPIREVHIEPLAPGPAARPLVDAVIELEDGEEVSVVSIHLVPTLVGTRWSEDRGDAAGGDLGQIETVRRRQAERLVEYVGRLSRPTILCGDFNALPRTVPIRTIASVLEDAWATRGNGFGFTSPSSFARSRIDYVFVRGLVVRDIQVAELGTSDHHSIVVKLARSR